MMPHPAIWCILSTFAKAQAVPAPFRAVLALDTPWLNARAVARM